MLKAESTPRAIVQLEGLGQFKNRMTSLSQDLMANRMYPESISLATDFE
jgi:hypothetical protein